MATNTDEPAVYTRLRNNAEAQLEAGTTPSTSQWSMGVDALRLLHRLSSNPESAEDALKLLHELQVHQVELDLQNEELAANERALVKDMHLYRELYDSAPLGYFLVDLDGVIIQGNLVAAELFGVRQGELAGHRIDTFLSPENRLVLLGLLRRVAESGARDSCTAEVCGTAPSRRLQFLASSSSRREYVLLACCDCTSAG